MSKVTGKKDVTYQDIADEFYEKIENKHPLFHNGKFYLYDGTSYRENTELTQSVRSFLRMSAYNQSNIIVGNVVPIVENLCYKPLSKYPSIPFYFGTEKFPSDVLPFKNGILNFKTLELMKHTHEYVSTFCLPYDYDPTAECPQWHNFLSEVFEDDKGKIELLQEWFGYCLLQTNEMQKTLLLIGLFRSGKGTTMKVLEAVIGKDNTTGYDLNSLLHNFGLWPLLNKQVAFIGEVNLVGKERTKILEKWKSVIGQDAMLIEEKHKPQYSAALPIKFVAACNEMPVFNDPSGALASRLLILEYNKTFFGREDRDLLTKLTSEVSGICNWAIEGLKRLKAQGRFSELQSSKEKANEFRRENSESFAFMQDCLLVERRFDSGQLDGVTLTDETVSITSDELDELAHEWSVSMKKEIPFNWLIRGIKSLVPKLKEHRKTVKGKKVTVYQGIAKKRDE